MLPKFLGIFSPEYSIHYSIDYFIHLLGIDTVKKTIQPRFRKFTSSSDDPRSPLGLLFQLPTALSMRPLSVTSIPLPRTLPRDPAPAAVGHDGFFRGEVVAPERAADSVPRSLVRTDLNIAFE